MQILEKIANSVGLMERLTAIHSKQGELSYISLWENSDRLASWLEQQLQSDKTPVVVYGHKNPMMLVCFLACVKSGRAYCPVDTSMPPERIESIIKAVGNKVVLATEPLEVQSFTGFTVTGTDDINKAIQTSEPITKEHWVKADDIFYIIFTSGSSGTPKGVKISSDNLSRYTDWSVTLGDSPAGKKGMVFLNQAPFSFDLSVMDLYTCLASGGTLHCIDKEMQSNTAEMLEYMKSGDINYWISTPSFADMCLSDAGFNSQLLPNLKVFLFCGEKLTNETAGKLYERFPNSIVVNTYGPTESTVAVTETVITKEMIDFPEPLPIGRAKPGTDIIILKEDGHFACDGERGEILIAGDTVSPGYFKNPKKTAEVFDVAEVNGKNVRTYRTGDEGYMVDGMVHYCGRIDLQVKLHGYRIELGDIEANLMQLEGVTGAAVVPKWNQGKIRYLVGFVVGNQSDRGFEDRKRVRASLREKLPEYMVPKKIVFIDQLPMTGNGKTDRKKLEEYM